MKNASTQLHRLALLVPARDDAKGLRGFAVRFFEAHIKGVSCAAGDAASQAMVNQPCIGGAAGDGQFEGVMLE